MDDEGSYMQPPGATSAINSAVMAVTLKGLLHGDPLPVGEVEIQLPSKWGQAARDTIPFLSDEQQCSYWQYPINGEIEGWSGRGCHRVSTDLADHVKCQCVGIFAIPILLSISLIVYSPLVFR